MLFIANKTARKQRTVNYEPFKMHSKSVLWVVLFLALPLAMIAQEEEVSEPVASSPFELDITISGHSLFGDGIKLLPGDTKTGMSYAGALKYRAGKVGIALSGGFWRNEYTASKPGVDYTQRLDDISAHFAAIGPYFILGEGNFTFEVNPKVGVQRFYFPHLIGRSTAGGNMGQIVERTRTDFDAGFSLGLGLQGRIVLDQQVALLLKLDYLTTVSDEAFKYLYTASGQTTTNTNPLQSLSFGVGASLAMGKAKESDLKSLAPTALDVSLGAGLNFLTGKGIDNLPGTKSAGYDASLVLNYRIGKSGIALRGGFWDNKYETTGTQRLDNISAHYVSIGPIIPIISPSIEQFRLEVVPHVGIQRIYFPHSRVVNGNQVFRQVRSNLEAGWSAGMTANALIPLDPKLDLKVFVDYSTTLTDRGFGFTVTGIDALTNRKSLNRINAGIGVAYNLMRKVTADDEMSPEKIADMIDQKEDDMAKDEEEVDMQVGGEKDAQEETTDPTMETVPPTEPPVTDPVVTDPPVETETRPTDPPAPEEIVPAPPTEAYTPPVVYRVQFVALSKDVKVFNDLKQYGTVILEYIPAKGLYRYMVGDAETEADGRALLRTIRTNGWPKSFLVKYENGIRSRVRE